MVQHGIGDLLRRERRHVAPVLGVDFVADGDVAHALCEFKRPHLVFGVGLGIYRVRRTEHYGANAEAAGK